MSSINIRNLRRDERAAWEPLWDSYIEFYAATMSRANTDLLWQRIHDADHPIQCRVAEDKIRNRLVGLVHFFPHATTWNAHPVCYLNDLFVSAQMRGGGTGAALIGAVVEEARTQGWDEVYWLTQQHNKVARGLYDRLTGGSAGFVNYRIETRQQG